jgi:hypothetical protein
MGNQTMTAKDNNRDRDSFATADELDAFALKYYSSEFSNPTRTGCPDSSALAAAAHSQNPPDQQFRDHLLSCSECFREYRAAALSSDTAHRRFRMPLLIAQRPVRALASAGIAAAMLVCSVLLLRALTSRQSGRDMAGAANAPPQRQGSQPDLKPNAAVPGPSVPVAPGEGENHLVGTIATLTVDLSEYAAFSASERDAGSGSEIRRAITIPASLVKLTLRLPSGSSKGAYRVGIAEPAFLNAIVTSSAASSDGRKITATLDGRRLAIDREYYLLVQREGQSPAYYPVVIRLPKTRS